MHMTSPGSSPFMQVISHVTLCYTTKVCLHIKLYISLSKYNAREHIQRERYLAALDEHILNLRCLPNLFEISVSITNLCFSWNTLFNYMPRTCNLSTCHLQMHYLCRRWSFSPTSEQKSVTKDKVGRVVGNKLSSHCMVAGCVCVPINSLCPYQQTLAPARQASNAIFTRTVTAVGLVLKNYYFTVSSTVLPCLPPYRVNFGPTEEQYNNRACVLVILLSD